MLKIASIFEVDFLINVFFEVYFISTKAKKYYSSVNKKSLDFFSPLIIYTSF